MSYLSQKCVYTCVLVFGPVVRFSLSEGRRRCLTLSAAARWPVVPGGPPPGGAVRRGGCGNGRAAADAAASAISGE